MEAGDHLTIETMTKQLGLECEVVRHLIRAGLIEDSEAGISLAALSRFQVKFVSGASLAKECPTSPRALAVWLAGRNTEPVVDPKINGSRQNFYRRLAIKHLSGEEKVTSLTNRGAVASKR